MVQETLAYRNCRAITQITTLIAVISNMLAICMNLYYYKMLRVESVLMAAYYLTYGDTSILCLGINLLIMAFSNCGVTSAKKIWMKMYVKIAGFYSVFLLIINTYLLTIYKIEFESRAGEAVNSKTPTGGLIIGMFSNTIPSIALRLTIKQFTYLLYTTALIHLLTIFINFINILIVKFIISIRINKQPIETPTIEDVCEAGMNTNVLEKRRIVSLRTSPLAIAHL
ncbi:hypothetical protein NUSPORA_00635 [Nucleospora cyclopteri]